MHLATETPAVSSHRGPIGDLITLVIGSGPDKISIAMTPHTAMMCAHSMKAEAEAIMNPARTAEILPFTGAKKGRARK